MFHHVRSDTSVHVYSLQINDNNFDIELSVANECADPLNTLLKCASKYDGTLETLLLVMRCAPDNTDAENDAREIVRAHDSLRSIIQKIYGENGNVWGLCIDEVNPAYLYLRREAIQFCLRTIGVFRRSTRTRRAQGCYAILTDAVKQLNSDGRQKDHWLGNHKDTRTRWIRTIIRATEEICAEMQTEHESACEWQLSVYFTALCVCVTQYAESLSRKFVRERSFGKILGHALGLEKCDAPPTVRSEREDHSLARFEKAMSVAMHRFQDLEHVVMPDEKKTWEGWLRRARARVDKYSEDTAILMDANVISTKLHRALTLLA